MSGGVILVVDYDDSARQFMRSVLEEFCGAHTVGAKNALEASSVVEESVVDLVILSVHAPRIEGVRVARLLKGHPATRRIPIIAMTTSGFRQELMALGCDDVLVMPLELQDLLASVQPYLLGARRPLQREALAGSVPRQT